MPITINEGTQSEVYTVDNAGTSIQVIKLDIGSGTALQDFGGTLPELTNVVGGTITRVEGGTVNITNLGAGTITRLEGGTIGEVTAGTVDTIGLRHADYWGTVINTGTSTLGTIRPAVSGSAIYITDLTISAGSATNVEIGDGGTANLILGTLYFAANGGIVQNRRTELRTSLGSALVYKQSADVPLSIEAAGYID